MAEGDTQSQFTWKRRPWTSRYPPLAVIGAALVLVLVVMPSALNLPQSNPSEVAEYAPVPPQRDNPPPQSNVSRLGLAGTSAITEEVEVPQPPDVGAGPGANPTVYDCVAGQQTEDPLSPPCSPFFNGDNGGATYSGVTKDEVAILVYIDGSITETTGTASYDGASEVSPLQGTYCDVDAEPNSQEKCFNEADQDHMYIRIVRAFSRYFNARYQTYGRHLHFWIYYSGATDGGGRRADAAENYDKLKPFAVVDFAIFRGHNKAYIDAMARDGVLVFASQEVQPRDFYDQYDPLVWTFWPDVEQLVDLYVEFVCKKVAPYPVSHSGPGILHGQPRKYAFMHTTDQAWPSLLRFRDLARPRLKEECGITPEIEVTFPFAGYAIDTGGDPAYARLNVAQMKQEEVTTILWFGGVEGKTGHAADEQKYYPEVFFAGDLNMESHAVGIFSNRNFHAQMAVVTPITREDRLDNQVGYQAWREGDPNGLKDPDGGWAAPFYRDVFMPALAVQVAGPRLHPVTVKEGLRAIPTIASDTPYVPACAFPRGHFCVQDATQEWWTNTDQAPGDDRPGCYKMVRDGARHLLGEWPAGDEVFANSADPCNAYNGGARVIIRTPGF